MYDKFLKLDIEKQDRIINASLKMFSKTLYKNATTDEIVKTASISKGSLFHYFKSKKELYLYLFDYAINIITSNFYNKLDLARTDIFERYQDIAMIKLNLMKIYPNIFEFLITALRDDTIDFKDELMAKYNAIINHNIIYNNIDKSKFRDDIDVDVAIKMIELTFTGYSNQEFANLDTYGVTTELQNKWLKDLNKFIEVMKKIYYKGE